MKMLDLAVVANVPYFPMLMLGHPQKAGHMSPGRNLPSLEGFEMGV